MWSKYKCVVLDLDETLVYTLADGEDEVKILQNLDLFKNPKLLNVRNRLYRLALHDATTPLGTGEKSNMWGVERPRLKQFLNFCFDYFDAVVIWSAGQPRYVEGICDNIFKYTKEPTLILTFNDLELVGKTYTKPLVRVAAKLNAMPQFSGKFDLSNIVAIDDKTYTFMQNHTNGVHIPNYTVLTGDEVLSDVKQNRMIDWLKSDNICLTELQNWLNKPEVKNSTDIRSVPKNNIFAQYTFEQ